MNDLARSKLFKIVKSYGRGVCNTPNTCEIFLHQHCGDLPDERQVLTQALRHGTVSRLIEAKDEPYVMLSGRLVEELTGDVGLSADDARWAVDSWALALGRHPSTAAPPPPPVQALPVESEETARSIVATSKVWPPLIVALGGAIGAVFATLVFTFLIYTLVSGPRGRAGFQADALALVAGVVMVVAGGIGGSLGAGGGWLLIQAQSLPTDANIARWRLVRGFLAAMGGAFGATLIGGWLSGLVGIALGGLMGAFSGAVVSGIRG